ncbi:hypothetical protein VZT92_019045 [Zoarces viviparus]|uniref:Uncharacterized protein n=1 Tax=Zoarces viviparus TaxID=48416 RepID=A0AAW1EK57_ZOAVI
MASKKKWSERRELRRDRPFSTRDDSSVASGTSGPGRPTTRGRFSESWKRLSSRGGSTKRGVLNSQQPPVRCFEDKLAPLDMSPKDKSMPRVLGGKWDRKGC